jgi:hypothetical protein
MEFEHHELSREDAIDLWEDGQSRGCYCHLGHPPCSYCLDGFNLELEEYLDLCHGYGPEEEDNPADAYDRAMKGV